MRVAVEAPRSPTGRPPLNEPPNCESFCGSGLVIAGWAAVAPGGAIIAPCGR